MQTSRMTVAWPPLTTWVKRLIVLLLVVYAAQVLGTWGAGLTPAQYSESVAQRFGLFGPALLAGAVWQPVTYGLLHSTTSFAHVLFNALGLYVFGGRVEEQLGSRAFLKLFVGGLLAAALAVMVGQYAPLVVGRPFLPVPVVGASGAISAVMAVFCWLSWDRWLHLFFIQLKGKHLLALVVAIDVLRATTSDLSLSAHLGGTAFGLLWISGKWRPASWRPDILMLRLRRWRIKRKLKVVDTPPKEWLN